MTVPTVGQLLHSFLIDHLPVHKGFRPGSVRGYRDALRLFLCFVAQDAHHRLTRLTLHDLSFERVQRFLKHLEEDRHNQIRTRNQRLAALHTFFDYVAQRVPDMVIVSERVAAIPTKRVAPAETQFLERDEVTTLLQHVPSKGVRAVRDHTLLLFLYNTGARVQEVAELRVGNLELGLQPRVRLHGKGDKWRTCPLWAETARQLQALLDQRAGQVLPDSYVFVSGAKRPLTRFGIYKVVRRHARCLERRRSGSGRRPISPHTLRHTTAVHLLESGVEVNVIRGWLGHVSLDTTNRYAEINLRTKEAALHACEPPVAGEDRPRAIWRDDAALLEWLNSL